MDGIQLITRVNDVKNSVRIILMTAIDVHDKLFREYSKKQIMNGFAQKPVSLQTLVQEVSDQFYSCEIQRICFLAIGIIKIFTNCKNKIPNDSFVHRINEYSYKILNEYLRFVLDFNNLSDLHYYPVQFIYPIYQCYTL